MTEKTYISAAQLLDDSYRLGVQILERGFRPSYIVGVWRGGTPVGIAVQELLDYFGIKTDHISIRTSLYTGIDTRARQVRVHGLNYLFQQINYDDSLLIVDDVYDSGRSIEAVIKHLKRRARRNSPENIKIATAYYKPKNNQTDRVPDFYVHEVENWLVFPHELDGLSENEILNEKPGTGPIAEVILKHRQANSRGKFSRDLTP